jgi:hypothetical protein
LIQLLELKLEFFETKFWGKKLETRDKPTGNHQISDWFTRNQNHSNAFLKNWNQRFLTNVKNCPTLVLSHQVGFLPNTRVDTLIIEH